ncbi:hypothetical protein [Kitasatospora sp. GP82]|uniref:hypothetical protein n=1 Tax=Kitasatospora sp. GP82 TaxID=3035089 RepID=UPI002475112F|nr:hypothetical protein [Kitasatospora sp. GP82]MDH6129957.1 hypothetical protein [Kitasatospora sp. GP82]
MTVFRCVRCNQPLTAPLHRLETFPNRPEPVDREIAPPTVPRGFYAIDPEPFGAPFVPNDDPQEPVAAMAGMTVHRDGAVLKSAGPKDTVVLHLDDAIGLHHHTERQQWIGCCGPNGMHGPNQVCACGNPVGTLVADCLMQNELHLDPRRVWAEHDRPPY